MKIVLEEKDIKKAIVDMLEEKGLSPIVDSMFIDSDETEVYAEVLLDE